MVAVGSMRDALICELSDIGGSTQDLNVSYQINGLVGHSSSVAGMSYTDRTDFCDDNDDSAGGADNCITFDLPPADEYAVTPGALILEIDFDRGNLRDESPFGTNNHGISVGSPNFVGDTIVLDGNDGLRINNSADINLGVHGQRTISIDFNTTDANSRQLIYEEGAGVRGLAIYIDGGQLYIGGWNIPAGESGWNPTFITAPINANTWYTATLVLDGNNTLQPNAMTGYLNGAQVGTAPGSQLWSHSGGIGVGYVNGSTIFHDGASNASSFFRGSLDDLKIYNRALDETEIPNL